MGVSAHLMPNVVKMNLFSFETIETYLRMIFREIESLRSIGGQLVEVQTS